MSVCKGKNTKIYRRLKSELKVRTSNKNLKQELKVGASPHRLNKLKKKIHRSICVGGCAV